MSEIQDPTTDVKLPPFDEIDPQLWLTMVESVFMARNVQLPATKYYNIVAKIPASVARQLKDIIQDTETTAAKKYWLLREEIPKRFSRTAEEKLSVLCSNTTIGDRKVRPFFTEMLDLSEGVLPYDVLVQRFWKTLPPLAQAMIGNNIRNICEMYKKNKKRDLAEENIMLEMAQSMMNSEMKKEKDFETKVEAVAKVPTYQQNRSWNPSPARQNGGRQFNPNGPLCRNHFQYGYRARFCLNPSTCQFNRRHPNQGNGDGRQ